MFEPPPCPIVIGLAAMELKGRGWTRGRCRHRAAILTVRVRVRAKG